MVETTERFTVPLWKCLSKRSLKELKKLQRELNGTEPFEEMESVEEIDRLMRKPTEYQAGDYSD